MSLFNHSKILCEALLLGEGWLGASDVIKLFGCCNRLKNRDLIIATKDEKWWTNGGTAWLKLNGQVSLKYPHNDLHIFCSSSDPSLVLSKVLTQDLLTSYFSKVNALKILLTQDFDEYSNICQIIKCCRNVSNFTCSSSNNITNDTSDISIVLQAISEMENITCLSIHHRNVDDGCLANVVKGCSSTVVHINFSGCRGVGVATLNEIREKCNSLEVLRLVGTCLVPQDIASLTVECPHVSLHLRNTFLTTKEIELQNKFKSFEVKTHFDPMDGTYALISMVNVWNKLTASDNDEDEEEELVNSYHPYYYGTIDMEVRCCDSINLGHCDCSRFRRPWVPNQWCYRHECYMGDNDDYFRFGLEISSENTLQDLQDKLCCLLDISPERLTFVSIRSCFRFNCSLILCFTTGFA